MLKGNSVATLHESDYCSITRTINARFEVSTRVFLNNMLADLRWFSRENIIIKNVMLPNCLLFLATQGLQPSRLPPKHMPLCGSGVLLRTFGLFVKNEAKKHVCTLCAKQLFLRLKGVCAIKSQEIWNIS
jgi:hypothetical protein